MIEYSDMLIKTLVWIIPGSDEWSDTDPDMYDRNLS